MKFISNRKVKVALLIALVSINILVSCGVTKTIESISCVKHKNGTDLPSKSFALEIKAIDFSGIERTNMAPPFSKSNFKLSHYTITVIGGTKEIASNVIKVDQSNPPEAFHVVQIIAELKKRSDVIDTLKYVVDHKGTFQYDYSASNPSTNGSDVQVFVKQVSNSDYFKYFGCDLYQVRVECNNTIQLFYMSQTGSSLSIINRGSKGFKGAKGADGIDGALLKEKRNGKPGDMGGTGGTGGTVTLYLDPSASNFINFFSIDNRGGDGGDGGDGGKAGVGGDRLLVDGKKDDGSDRVLIDGKKNDGTAGAKGSQGNLGANGPALIIINREVSPFEI